MNNQLPEEHKGRKAIKYRGVECLNCGHPLDLSDVHCSYCGQLNTTKSLSLKDFFGEFILSIITYDSKLRHTLKDLLFKPGVITRNYVKGQRLKYANPFRFYLSVSIIFFIVQGLISSFTGTNNLIDDVNTKDSIQFGPTGDNFKFYKSPANTPNVDSIINKTLADVQVQKNEETTSIGLDSLILNSMKKDTIQTYDHISEATLDTMSWAEGTFKRFELYMDFYKTTEIKSPTVAFDSLHHENNKLNRWIYQKNMAFIQIEENPTDFVSYILDKTPFFLFFFTPFFALFFSLIYSRKKFNYIEHIIFIFHIFSFIFLVMLIALIPEAILGTELITTILFTLIGPFYFYKALRNFYQQNRALTVVKFLFLNVVFSLSASIGGILFFVITAAMY